MALSAPPGSIVTPAVLRKAMTPVPPSQCPSVVSVPAIETDEFRNGRINIGRGEIEDIDLHEILKAFHDAPDADFVTIDGGDESVRVSKERGFLLVKVDDDNDRVRVRLPLDVVDALLSGGDDELDLIAALDALADHGGGDLVTVESDHESIRVWIDSNDGGE